VSALVHFYAEQAKIRGEAWRVTAVALLLAGTLGLIASAGVGPLMVALVAAVVRLADFITFGLLSGVRLAMKAFIGGAFADFGQYIDGSDKNGFLATSQLSKLWRFGIMMLPGVALMLTGYWWVRQRISQHGDDAMVGLLSTQPARRGDPEEAQTLRLAEELAIAAGIATPTVLIVGNAGANLAVVGRDHQSWTLLVTRGFVLRLKREEQRGAIAIAVSRIVNGDLGTSTSISALGSASGLLRTVLDWPVSTSARERMRLVLALKSGTNEHASLVEVERRLQLAGHERMSETNKIDHDKLTLFEKARGYVMLPFHAMSFGYMMLGGLFSQVVIATALGFTLSWRLRQADATAVRLLANADEVARGLEALSGGIPDKAKPWAQFFVLPSTSMVPAGATMTEISALALADSDPSELGLVTGNTTKEGRLRRLAKLGATGPVPFTVMDLPWYVLAFVGGLLALAAGMMGFLIGCFALFFTVFGALFGYGVAYLIL
jgi:hypothetical protein